EGVHRSDRFLVLTFEKGGVTGSFPAAFMRLDVGDLERFPQEGAINIAVDLVRRLSPDSLSVLEFKTEAEVAFAEKIVKHPPLDKIESSFHHVRFERELDPTAHPGFFRSQPSKNMMPLLEGRNIHQFTSTFSTDYRFWVREKDARELLLGRTEDVGQALSYQTYRLGFRKIANKTNERTMISTIIPPRLVSENLQTCSVFREDGIRVVTNADMIVLCAIFNSIVYDSIIRMKVDANMNFFLVYSTQVPRLTEKDSAYELILKRAARLICTTSEFDDLAKEVGLNG
ncbi:MAG: ATP-binding protein, partial [Bacteroidota bacterium]